MEWSHDIGWHRILETSKLKKPTLRKEGSVMSVCQMISVAAIAPTRPSSPGSCVQTSAQPSGLRFLGYKSSLRTAVDGLDVDVLMAAIKHDRPRPLHFSLLTIQSTRFLMYVSDCAKVSVVGPSLSYLRNNPAIACWSLTRSTIWLGQKNLPQRSGLEDDFLGLKETASIWKNNACQEIFWQTWAVATKSCGVVYLWLVVDRDSNHP